MRMKPANDNKPKYVRGSFADAIPAVLEYRNRPDSPPDPLQSSWSTDPSTVIPDTDGSSAPAKYEEDLLLEITPSLQQIEREVKTGRVERNADGQIISIGRLKFSDGNQFERAMVNGETGVEAKKVRMRAGSMLGTTEKVGAPHGGSAPAVVTIGNKHFTGFLGGWDKDGDPKHWRPYTPGKLRRGKRKNLNPEQSAQLIKDAIANTKVMPSVTVCPPGVACGTARFSDQFIGMKIGSTGKGGAPGWVDYFIAGREHDDWMEALSLIEGPAAEALATAMSASSFAEVGMAVGQSRSYADKRGGGRKALVAANDNLTEVYKKIA